MFNMKVEKLRWRSLLTDTLPYEVPVIFSNDKLFAALVSSFRNSEVKKEFSKLTEIRPSGTIPYSYNIVKDRGNVTRLGVIHPLWQLRMAEFYEMYARSILEFCKKSEYSLRRPTAIASVFSKSELSQGGTQKLGIPHADEEDGEIDVAHMVSYFSYSKYNLLGKFMESAEFIRLEKRFSRLRTLDVSKCFFHIYTHTITWAVKDKYFSKTNRNAYSFEGCFDELMQKSNHNETNGIVVGPEFSRIFAEVIFQEIDRKILGKLQHLTHDKEYAVRRYVDDYFVFANKDSTIDDIEDAIRSELEGYKLFINEKKTATHSRPFVSQISIARSEIGAALTAMTEHFSGLAECRDPKELRRRGKGIRDQVGKIRIIVAKYSVGFHTISGWLLSSLRGLLRSTIIAANSELAPEYMESITDVASSILNVVFYVCALDTRVRTTYSLCQIVSLVHNGRSRFKADQSDRLMHVISEEITLLIENILAKGALRNDCDNIELFNLLICGAQFIGARFAISPSPMKALSLIIESSRLSYFGYVTAKFCMLKDSDHFADKLKCLNEAVKDRLSDAPHRFREDAEIYLLLSDYLSAPDVALGDKRSMIKFCVGGDPSNQTVEALGAYVGFVDWSGLRIQHLLARKELRPVYAWA